MIQNLTELIFLSLFHQSWDAKTSTVKPPSNRYFRTVVPCIEVVFFKSFQISSIDRGIKLVGFSFAHIVSLYQVFFEEHSVKNLLSHSFYYSVSSLQTPLDKKKMFR